MEIDERIIRLETAIEQNTKDIAELKRDINSIDKEQVKTTIEMTEIKGDIKAILSSVKLLNENWKDFDKTQKDNANKIKMQVIGAIITGIIAFIFVYLKMK